MEKQTQDREALYAREEPPGDPIPINVRAYAINDAAPGDAEIREAVRALTNGRAGGASHIRAEDIKGWLRGALAEEDPEGDAPPGAGDN